MQPGRKGGNIGVGNARDSEERENMERTIAAEANGRTYIEHVKYGYLTGKRTVSLHVAGVFKSHTGVVHSAYATFDADTGKLYSLIADGRECSGGIVTNADQANAMPRCPKRCSEGHTFVTRTLTFPFTD